MKKLISCIISAALGLWLAVLFIPGVWVNLYSDSNFFGFPLTASWEIFLLLGVVLGALNFFVKPILNIITLPLRIITLGLFDFISNMALIWVVDYMFREFNAPILYPLLWTSLIIFGLNIIISKLLGKE
jgi:putative membrane protein